MFGQSLLSGAFGSAACTTDTDQLFATDATATTTATYQLNGVTTSIPSNTYPGTASNITYAAGKFDNAAVYNGSSSLITIPLNTVNVGSAYTVSLWFNAVNVGVNTGIFTNQGTSAISNQIAINLINSTTISVASIVNNGSNTVDAISTTVPTMSANNWYNLVVVADRSLSNKLKLYLNGVEASNYSFNAGAGSNTLYSIAQIGRADGRFFNGKLDQFRFFNSSLPQSAVTVLSNETVATSSSASINYVDANPNSIAYYKMSDATDQFGNYNGTATNVDFNTEGKFGFAGAFNGSSSYLTTGLTLPANSTMTFSFWFKWPSSQPTGGDIYLLSDLDSSANGNRIDIRIAQGSSNNIFIDVGNGSSRDNKNTGFIPNNDTWYNLVVTLNGTAVKMYIDGTQKVSYTSSVAFGTAGSDPIVLGRAGAYNCCYLKCTIDQVRIFTSTLNQAAVTSLYNETVATSSSADVNYQLANPNSVAYYKMSDATDQIGNYNGTSDKVNFNTEGKFGFAGKFNGSDSYVSLPAGINKNNNFSWSFWIKFDSMTQYDTPIGFFMNGSTNFIDMVSVGRLGFYDGNSRLNTPTGTFATGNWYHVVLSKSSTTGRKFYVNGIQVASDSVNTNSGGTTGGRNLFGAYSSGGNPTTAAFALDGKLDQIRIYDSAISAANVTTLYNEIECPAATVINSFNTVIYTGNGSSQNLNIGFNADLTWFKSRTQTYGDNSLVDTLRGAYNLTTNKTAAQEATNGGIVINNNNTVTAAVVSGNLAGEINESGEDYVSFNWKGGGITDTNTDGTIESSVSANKEAGFSIVKWEGTDANATVGHGLSAKPQLILFKATAANNNWGVYNETITATKFLILNTTAFAANSSTAFNNTEPTSSVISVGTSGSFNRSGGMIAYCFTSIPGYSRVGSYIGNGSPTGPIIYTGFKPRFIMTKPSSIGDNWSIWGVNQSGNDIDQILVANNNASQSAVGFGRYNITLSSTGFQLKRSDSQINQNGATYIFLAIA